MEFIEQYKIAVKNPVAAIINGHFTRLDKKIRVDCVLHIIERHTPQGRRVYESSALFLFQVAFTKKYPELSLFVQHSLHKGVYAEIKGKTLSKEEVAELENLMRDLVAKELPIKRIARDWEVSLKMMLEKKREDLYDLFKYYTPTQYKCYELEGVEESLYLPLVINTKFLKYFSLKKYQNGLVIILPDFEEGEQVPEFVDRPKLFSTYNEYHDWSRILKVRTVGQLNRYIMNDDIHDLVKVAEALHEKKVAQIADQITKKSYVPRIILIAGPSSSGKTTFAKRLGIQLRVNMHKPVAISLDNYFVDRDKTPRDQDGNYDFESLEAINVSLFNNHLQKLLSGEEIEIPRFDFESGTHRRSGVKYKLEKDHIVIIEGIHGLNPKLTEHIEERDKFRIYISALTQLNIHRHDRVPASDTRLIRRIVRDSFFRGYTAAETLDRWRFVRAGEKRNIFPLQENADVFFNSALFYELAVLKGPAERELLRVESNDPLFAEAQRLLKFLSYFRPIESKYVPGTSILKEFIGESSFKY